MVNKKINYFPDQPVWHQIIPGVIIIFQSDDQLRGLLILEKTDAVGFGFGFDFDDQQQISQSFIETKVITGELQSLTPRQIKNINSGWWQLTSDQFNQIKTTAFFAALEQEFGLTHPISPFNRLQLEQLLIDSR